MASICFSGITHLTSLASTAIDRLLSSPAQPPTVTVTTVVNTVTPVQVIASIQSPEHHGDGHGYETPADSSGPPSLVDETESESDAEFASAESDSDSSAAPLDAAPVYLISGATAVEAMQQVAAAAEAQAAAAVPGERLWSVNDRGQRVWYDANMARWRQPNGQFARAPMRLA